MKPATKDDLILLFFILAAFLCACVAAIEYDLGKRFDKIEQSCGPK